MHPRPAAVSDEGSQKHSRGCLILATAKVISWKLVLSVSIISSYISIHRLLLITIPPFWGSCFEGELISWYEMVVLHPKKGWILVLRSVVSFITKIASGPQLMLITGKLQNCFWTRLHPHPRPLLHLPLQQAFIAKYLFFSTNVMCLCLFRPVKHWWLSQRHHPRTCQPSKCTLGRFCTPFAWFSESKVNQESSEVFVHCYTLAAAPHGGEK